MLQKGLKLSFTLVLMCIFSQACVHQVKKAELQPFSQDEFERGVASWYGDDFHGRRTANGEIYDMHKLTAAHQTLPFNTIVEVENQSNGLKVLVRINDRGPFVKGRIIDLSLAAARRLEMVGPGTAPVSLRITSPGNRDYRRGAPLRVVFFLQAGAFRDKTNAERRLRELTALTRAGLFSLVLNEGIYRIWSKQYESRSEAKELQDFLALKGVESVLRETFR